MSQDEPGANSSVASKIEGLGIRFSIDSMKLDEEWVNHPQMVYNVNALVAELQSDADQAKADFDNVGARLDSEIRENPASYGLAKATETSIYNARMVQPEYLAAQKKVHNTKYELQLAIAASNALEHKKRALSMLVELWLRDYYSDPSPRPMSQQSEDFDKGAIRSRGRRRTEERSDDVDGE